MAEAIRGEYHQKVDGKARLLIPAPFRRVLDAGDTRGSDSPRTRVIIVYGGKHRTFCECYSFAEAEALAAQVARLPAGSKARLKAERDLITLSATAELDDDGRIVLPPRVREKLGITAEMLKDGVETALAGATNRFTIWRKDVYDDQFLGADDDEDDDLDPLALLGQAAQGA
jgi:MraZ protein